MANVECYIDGLEQDKSVLDLASNLIDKVRASDNPAGVIWIEYYASDGETLAQVHLLPEGGADEVKTHHPELAERF